MKTFDDFSKTSKYRVRTENRIARKRRKHTKTKNSFSKRIGGKYKLKPVFKNDEYNLGAQIKQTR